MPEVIATAAAAWHLFSRLAYFAVLWKVLPVQSIASGMRDRAEGEAEYAAFRRRILRLQFWDAASFIFLCLATANTLPWEGRPILPVAVGAALAAAGVFFKGWAAAWLGPGAYTWRDFFVRTEAFKPCLGGPYRFLSDPMYTAGYLHAWGLALALLSWPGLAAAAICQGSMLLVARFVERPHMGRVAGPR